jgi:signal transduction histidine kinase
VAIAVLVAVSNVTAQTLDSLLAAYRESIGPRAKLELLTRLGWSYENNMAYSKALQYYREAIDLMNTSEISREDELTILRHAAYCYDETSDYEHEIEMYQNILSHHEQDGNSAEKIKVLQTLSSLYVRMSNLEKAAQYNMQMLDIGQRQKNYLWMAIAYNNLGVIYNGLKKEQESAEYFSKSYSLVAKENASMSDESKATILTNLGVSFASVGNFQEAQHLLAEALTIRRNGNDTLSIAQALNYAASLEYVHNNIDKSITFVSEAVSLLERKAPSDDRIAALSSSYKLMSEIMLKKNDLAAFKKYNQLYNDQQLAILEKERKRNKLLLEHQIDIEKRENQMTLLLADKAKREYQLRQTEMEREKRENELKLQTNELLVLKQQNQLQAIHFKNQKLENEKISQTLELLKQRAEASDQRQKMDLLKKDQALQKYQLETRKREIDQLEKDKQLNARTRFYGLMIMLLLSLLLVLITMLFWNRSKKNKKLAEQSKVISDMNHEIVAQNEELMTVNDQLNLRSQELSDRNKNLIEAQQIIHNQNEKLLTYNKNLEHEVQNRTKELTKSNTELLERTTQLEQFTYALSHNIRAPLARLLGLADLITKTGNESERNFIIQKIRENSLQLDDVIKDLNHILSMKAKQDLPLEEVDLEATISKSLEKLEDLIRTNNPHIIIDFSHVRRLCTVSAYLENIFYNLISNAIKYRCPDRECRINVHADKQGDRIMLTISDNGMGIDLTQHREKLFGLYKRFHPFIEGKGLGLYLVKTQVEAMHGQIEVDSSTDYGTTFRISLQTNTTAAA